MNEQEHKARELARRIARQLESGNSSRDESDEHTELARLQAQVAELNRRLAQAENSDFDATIDNARRASSPSSDSPSDDASFGASAYSTNRSANPLPTFEHKPSSIGTGGTYVSAVHPSQQRFGIDEAVSELVNFLEQSSATTSTKTCDLELGDKPCDHCEMCSSRGF